MLPERLSVSEHLRPMTQQAIKRFAMVAGEASGDWLGANLLREMRLRWPEMCACGIGGSAMAAQGFEAWWPSERLAVRGYVEVLPRYLELVRMRKELGRRIERARPDLFIGIDAPDFNLDLEIRLRACGIKTIHYVSPSFWAWRADKVGKLKRAADLVLCVFPFEPALLQAQGIRASYVGHPLASVIPLQADQAQARVALGLNPLDTVVALLPGSRADEVKHLTGRFLSAASILAKTRPDMRFVLPAIPSLFGQLRRAVQVAGMVERVMVLDGRSHEALAACDLSLVASGTATLEAALFKRPMVIAYHMNPLSWRITNVKRLQPWVGLPNILCQDMVVPELLQERATPQALAQAVMAWLEQPERAGALRRKFTAMHQTLRRDSAALALQAIEDLCGPPRF